jgi:hypothetical protein
MESHQFDLLTQKLSGPNVSRRRVAHTFAVALAGGALAGLATRLGLTGSAAKQKHASRKHARHASHHPASRHQHADDPHSQGKGQKHHKSKKRKDPKSPSSPPSPLPPGCQNCNECQMCQNGACVADPALNGVRCLGSGTACGYCAGGQCAASALPPCDDGTCPQAGQCCPGEKRCPDPNPDGPGFACTGLDDCCPDQRRCAGGCIYKQACCPEERPQDCGQCGVICVNGTWQCSAQRPCGDGTCVAHDECCDGEKPCSGGGCVPRGICCSGERKCGETCVSTELCCPDEPPANCTYPEKERCCHGEKVCRGEWDTPTCFPYGGWLTYNDETCDCECPPDSVPTGADVRACCPASHPHALSGNLCIGDVWNEHVCMIGFKDCSDTSPQCCPEQYPWPPE